MEGTPAMVKVVSLKGRKPQMLQPDEVYIGRALHMSGWNLSGSKWQNPFRITLMHKPGDGSRTEVLRKYRDWIKTQPHLIESLHELKGKTLCCWCKPEACHGDILAELMN